MLLQNILPGFIIGIKIACIVTKLLKHLKQKIMKHKIILSLGIATALFAACEKNDLQPPTPTTPPPPTATDFVVKYEFTASRAADYRLAYKRDTIIVDEFINTTTWTKTVNVARTSTSRTARLSVYPPESWVGTANTANINVKLSIDGVVKKDTSGVLAGFDRALGITVQTPF